MIKPEPRIHLGDLASSPGQQSAKIDLGDGLPVKSVTFASIEFTSIPTEAEIEEAVNRVIQQLQDRHQ